MKSDYEKWRKPTNIYILSDLMYSSNWLVDEEDDNEETMRLIPGEMLEWDENDECDDFFFISHGWGPYLEVIKTRCWLVLVIY